MFTNFAHGSFIINLVKKAITKYRILEAQFDRVYSESATHQFINNLSNKLKTWFSESAMNKFPIRDEENTESVIQNSKFISKFKKLETALYAFLEKSTAIRFIKKLKETFEKNTFKKIGIVIILAVVTNILILLKLSKQIDFLGWVARLGFLFIGFMCLFFEGNWHDVRKTSITLKLFKNANKTKIDQ